MKSELSCPVCGSDMVYHRIDDGITRAYIRKNSTGTVELESIHCSNDGSISIYCRRDASHKLSEELKLKIISIAEDFGY